MKRALILLALFAAPLPAQMPKAALADTQLPDARQEVQATALMHTLRCLVCQGQSIADSDADMAGDMRALVREKIVKGESPEQIRAWLIARYGNWVSYDPPLDRTTWPLWIMPVLIVIGGAALARGRFRRRRR